MMKKTIYFIIFVLAISFSLGCGKPKTETPTNNNTAVEQNKEETSNENKIEVSEDKKKSVEISKDYPSDKFPIYQDSFVLTCIELEGGYTITAYAKDDVKKVMEFYKTVLNGAKVTNETVTEESLTSFGNKDGYVYQIDVGKSNEFEGYKTSILISIQPEK